MNVPDWLWQELAADAIWTAITVGAAWACHHREAVRNNLRTRQPVYISAASGGSSSAHAALTVGKDADLRWRIEAPTPSLARRLEELASWYLHVS